MNEKIGRINEYLCQDPRSCVKYKQSNTLIFDFDKKIFLTSLTMLSYLKIKLFFSARLKLLNAIIAYFELSSLGEKKMKNLSKAELQNLLMYKLMTSKHKKWIIILNDIEYEKSVLKKLLIMIIARAESGNLISIFSKKQIIPDSFGQSIDKNFIYDAFEI